MFTLFAQLTRLRNWNRWTPTVGAEAATDETPGEGVPQRLMASAGARAGLDPRQARELRRAASAYLRVVR